MTQWGIDTPSHPSGEELKAAGVQRVVLYLSRYSWKVPTPTEIDTIRQNGIGIDFVFEDSGTQAQMGTAQGQADAEFALQQAKSLIGSDTGGAIYFAVDYDSSVDVTAVDPYFDGVASVLAKTRCGPYGGVDVCRHLKSRGFDALFQTIAWSRGEVAEDLWVYQYDVNKVVAGVGVDYDHFYNPASAWYPRPVVVPPKPKDPNHYLWFDEFRGNVVAYDQLRRHKLKNRKLLAKLESVLLAGAKRIARNVIADVPKAGTPERQAAWAKDRRGWRYSQLIKRANGKRVVK